MFYKYNKNINNKHLYNRYIKIVILFITLFLISCTVALEKPSNYMALANIESISAEYRELEELIVVDIATQQLFFLKKGKIDEIYSVSTSVYGTGSKVIALRPP